MRTWLTGMRRRVNGEFYRTRARRPSRVEPSRCAATAGAATARELPEASGSLYIARSPRRRGGSADCPARARPSRSRGGIDVAHDRHAGAAHARPGRPARARADEEDRGARPGADRQGSVGERRRLPARQREERGAARHAHLARQSGLQRRRAAAVLRADEDARPPLQEGRRRRVLVAPEGQDGEVQHLPRVRGCRHQVGHRRRRRLRAERRQQRARSCRSPTRSVPAARRTPKHLADVLELFKKQSERAKGSAAK